MSPFPLHRLMVAALCGATSLMASAEISCRQNGDFAGCREGGVQRYVTWPNQPTWSSGLMSWSYNPAGQPAWATTADTLATIQAAMAKWSAVCNVRFEYLGTTSTAPTVNEGANIIGWNYAEGFSGFTKYWWRGSNYNFSDVDIRLDPDRVTSAAQLPGLLNHELGHAIGLDHSDTESAIMFAAPYHSYSYQETLRDDDIAGCVALYGAPAPTVPAPTASSDSDRIFNWAEKVYSTYFPGNASAGTYLAYTYRYYPTSGLYLATSNGRVFVHGGAFNLQDVGAVADFLGLAAAAGY